MIAVDHFVPSPEATVMVLAVTRKTLEVTTTAAVTFSRGRHLRKVVVDNTRDRCDWLQSCGRVGHWQWWLFTTSRATHNGVGPHHVVILVVQVVTYGAKGCSTFMIILIELNCINFV